MCLGRILSCLASAYERAETRVREVANSDYCFRVPLLVCALGCCGRQRGRDVRGIVLAVPAQLEFVHTVSA